MKKTLILFAVLSLLVCTVFNAFAGDVEKALSHDLSECSGIIKQLAGRLRSGAIPTDGLARLKRCAEALQADRLLLAERQVALAERAATLDGTASDRQDGVSSDLLRNLDELLLHLDTVDASATPPDLEVLQRLLDTLIPKRSRPLLGALPYKHTNHPPREPASTPVVKPAYKGGDRSVYAADTAASPEAPLSREIVELAQSLQWNPVLIYEWVKNNVETEWYWGSMKGAEETLHQKSGNDADQASLLVALLRASNFPARYVRGTIDFFPDIERAKNLTGLDDPAKIADFFRKAGIPSTPVISGGRVSNLHIEHVWVEAFIPYANYRGAVVDDQGKIWLGLDTSIKPQGYTRTTGGGIPSDTLSTLRDDYLNTVQTLSPLDYLTGKLDEQLAVSQPGTTWASLKDSATLIPDVLKIIPDSMQFNQIAITGEYQSLPEDLKHKLTFSATANNSELFTLTLDTLKLSNKRLALRAEPETVEDQNTIDSFGGLDNTPAYLVRLRPVLTLDGERLIVAQDGLPMGADFTLNIDIVTPNGTERISSGHINGNLSVIGVVEQKAQTPTAITEEDDAEAILHKEAIGYIERWNKAEDDLAALLGQRLSRPTVTIATVGGQMAVTTLLDITHDMQWRGVYLDAGYRRIETTGRNGQEREFMRLSALQGSVLENRIFEDDLKVDSVSAAKLLQLARANGTPIVTIDKASIDSILPTLPFDDAVNADIANAVNQGLTVTIPQNEVVYQDWSGIGYIKEDLTTGESGWMLSGNVAGGMTAWSTDHWDDPATRMVAAALMAPYSNPPNNDPASATLIAKIGATDFQNDIAGKQLALPLKVMVFDISGHPVLGAAVHFSVRAGGGSFDGSGTVSIDVLTDGRGIASVPYFLGKKTDSNPTYFNESGKPYSKQVDENIVDAVLPANGKGIVSPFTVYGTPGVPHHIVSKSLPKSALVLNFAGSVIVGVEDENNNPVANAQVKFQTADAAGFASCYSLTGAKPASLVNSDNTCFNNNNIPYYGECGSPLTTATQFSGYDGSAYISVILGSIPGARYDIIATTPGISPETFSYATYTFGNQCGSNSDPATLLYTSYTYPIDTYGNNINSARSGSIIPLNARTYAVRENATSADVTGSCGILCSKIIGARTFTTNTDFVASSLTFTTPNDSGGTTDLAGTAQSNGMFSGTYTLKPGINSITINGAATITRDRTEVCPACTTVHENVNLNASSTMVVYGVDIAMPSPSSLVVTTDAKGYSQHDLVVPFTISPAEYKAQISYVALYENGEPYAYLMAEKNGAGSVTFIKGFQFVPGNNYDLQVILNPGSGVEIKSDKTPLNIIGAQINLQRTHHLSKFDSSVPIDINTAYTDRYELIPVKVTESSTVTVSILDANQQHPMVLATSTLAPGNYSFSVDYEQIRSAGFSTALNPNYYIQVKNSYGNPAVDHVTLYSGQLSELTEGQMLGQTMVHDVLIQSGTLNLSRQDFVFNGRGPQLAFTRSYSNQSSPHGITPLGNGWSHSLDMKLTPISSDITGAAGLPTWIIPLRGNIFSNSAIPTTPNSWTVVQVNGTTFKKSSGTWYSERGRHGTLEEISATATTPTGYRFTAKDGTRYIYNNALGDMPVSRIEDRNGNVMTFAYDGQLLSKVTDAVGRICNFTYATQSSLIVGDPTRLTGITCPDNIGLTFTYDPQGYLKTAIRGDRIETYDYASETGITGGEYNLVKATDANNHSFSYDYFTPAELPLSSWNVARSVKPLKSQDVVKSVTYPSQGTTPVKARFAYDTTTANKRTVTDLRGNDTIYTLNYFGNPLKIEEPPDRNGAVKTTLMTWSIDEGKPDNVTTSKTDPLNNRTYYEYDQRGNITKETDPYGKIITTTWNQKFSLPENRVDRNNISHGWQYDSKGNLLQETDGDGKQSSHTWYATGERQTSTDPRNNTTRFTYDSWGNPASVKGAEGSETKFEYDIRGRRTAQIDPNGKRTEYAYDALDYPATTTLPQHDSYSLVSGSSRIKTQNHDAVGNLISETDRLGLTLTYSYTKRNQVKTITRSSGGTKTFDYDNNGNLISESDWKGVASSHEYDALNRRTKTINRLGDFRLMAYDLNSNLTEETDAEGRITNHEYDKLNRLIKTIQSALPGLSRGELILSYFDEADPKTNLKTETDQEGNSSSYEYNGRYLRTKRTNALLDVHLWEYDDSGNLSKETDEEGHPVRHEYDQQNRVIADIRSHNGSDIKTTYGYDLAGNRINSTDPLGHKTETRFDEWNRPWQVIDAENFVSSNELDGDGNKVKTTDANGNNRTTTRDQRGLVLSSIDGEGFETKYTYDLNGNNETVTYANTSVTSIAYDTEDRKLLTTEAQGQPEERSSGVILYDKVGNPLKVKDGNGNITTTDYNALNLPVKITDAKGKFSSSDYYKTGKIKTGTNRRTATTTTEYDKLWRVTKVTDPLNQTVESTYDKVGNVKQSKDKRGVISEIDYDDLYRPIEKRRAAIRLASYEYDNANNVTADIDANDNRTEYVYTKRNQKEKATFADNTSRSMTYDGNGNLKTETDEEGVVTSYGYDRENRHTATERAGELNQKSYNEMGNLAAEIRPEGNSRTFNYDKLKRMISAIDDPWGPSLTTRFEYDKNNNLTKTTDPRGNVVENTYDELNRKTGHTQKKAAGDLATSYGYDEEGNLTKLTDAKLQVSTYVYDFLNRKTENHYGGLDITTGYDENNNVTTTSISGTGTSLAETSQSQYDNLDRLKTSTQRGTQVSYSYDNNGNRLSVGTPSSSTGYTYDARNRVKTASVGSAITSFDYYLDSKKKTVTYPNGAKEEYEYFATNRVKTLTNSINGSVLSKFDYSYDRNGNRLSQDETRGARNISTGYHYDTLDRMTDYSVTENSATTRSDYTFEGYNRKTESTTASTPLSTSITKTYTYDETDWLTKIVDGTKTITYVFDNNGNTISKTDSTDQTKPVILEYDARDKLTKASKGASILGRYVYNANGYRIRQLNSDRGDVDYYYDGTAVIEERTNGNLLAHYRYAGKLYSLTDGTSIQYFHQDALGSTTDLTDDTGVTKASYFLNPWGMIVDSIGSSVNRRIFTGKEIDQNTGLIYFGARYYDPDTARFTTQDTYLGEQGTPPSLHRYLYAYSNPTVYIDLEGYLSWDEFKAGTSDAWAGVKTAVKSGWQALPAVTKKGFASFDKALDNAYDTAQKNNLPGINNLAVQLGLTAGITGTKAMLGMGSYPLVKASQLSEYSEDTSKIQNFPLYASGVRDTYRASEAFAKDSSLENGAQVVQAAAGTFLEAIGLSYGPKSIADTYNGAGPKSGMTVEIPSNTEFTNLKSIKGTTYEGTLYRYELPDRVDTTWQTHEWNIASDHRYSGSGKGGVYGSTSQKTAFKEMEHYNALDGREVVSKDVKVDGILDLTDKSVRRQLDISLDTLASDSYSVTQKLGDKTREAGFNGIKAPSARNKGGSNIIMFEGW